MNELQEMLVFGYARREARLLLYLESPVYRHGQRPAASDLKPVCLTLWTRPRSSDGESHSELLVKDGVMSDARVSIRFDE